MGSAAEYRRKKVVTPSARRKVVDYLRATHGLGISKACALTSASRSTYHYRSTRYDSPVIAALTALRDRHPRRGFGVFYKWLRAAGQPWNCWARTPRLQGARDADP